MAKLTISFELSPSDFPFLLALANGGELRTPNPSSEGFRTRGPFNLEDLLRDLAREGGEGDKTPATPPEGPQGSDEVEGTARGPESFLVDLERDFMPLKGDL